MKRHIITEEEREVMRLQSQLPPLPLAEDFRVDYGDLEMQAVDEYCYNQSYGIKANYLVECPTHAIAISAVDKYLVYRYVYYTMRKRGINSYPHLRVKEVAQRWIDLTKEQEVKVGRVGATHCDDYTTWKKRTRIIPRDNIYIPTDLPYMDGYTYTSNITDAFRKYGQRLNGTINKFDANAEYLAKTHQDDLFYAYLNNDARIEKYLHAIKIANRHSYKPTDALRWLSYVDILHYNGRDTYNPFYICPIDFDKAMQREYDYRTRHEEIRREIQRREHDEEMRRRAKEAIAKKEEANKQYLIDKKAFLGLEFTSSDGTIKFHVLQDIEEFYNEGAEMHHCVFAMGYYLKKNSLILSARDAKTDERLATLELDLNTMKINQCFAQHDTKPQRDTDIRMAVDINIGMIKKLKRKAS